jgi:hypothetical protein
LSFLEVVLVEDSLFSTIVLNLNKEKFHRETISFLLKKTLPLLSSLINKAIIGKSQIPINTKKILKENINQPF